ncbi:UDP-N-acetylglucosamine 2-epimerase (non-hydrolyzing) [bacterium]|nr:UDP-N-acetylglucosamine 2-epimerase (non-hydrolyzing) [bacterium]
MKIVTLVGARPQFIKAAPLSFAYRDAGIEEIMVHSGQHYDHRMSQVFFDEMKIPKPDVNLHVGSGSQGKQTAEILSRFEEVLEEHTPDMVIVHGDTNTTIAGALAACKLQIPIAHNESGLRSFNRSMPEEHNRVLTDHCSDILFCPTERAVVQLAKEGIQNNVHFVGDVMYDATLLFTPVAKEKSRILAEHKLNPGEYYLSTMHRPYTVDNKERLNSIISTFGKLDKQIVLPVHPRTQKKMDEFKIPVPENLLLIDPIGYLDMVNLTHNCCMVFTDSGGLQREAFYQSKPCVVLRPETEWMEIIEAEWGRIADIDEKILLSSIGNKWWSDERPILLGDGDTAGKIVEIIRTNFV